MSILAAKRISIAMDAQAVRNTGPACSDQTATDASCLDQANCPMAYNVLLRDNKADIPSSCLSSSPSPSTKLPKHRRPDSTIHFKAVQSAAMPGDSKKRPFAVMQNEPVQKNCSQREPRADQIAGMAARSQAPKSSGPAHASDIKKQFTVPTKPISKGCSAVSNPRAKATNNQQNSEAQRISEASQSSETMELQHSQDNLVKQQPGRDNPFTVTQALERHPQTQQLKAKYVVNPQALWKEMDIHRSLIGTSPGYL